MLLCAGLGTRLRPLTNAVPKPLVPAPDEPLAFHALRRLARAGTSLCVINLHHLPRAVKEAVGPRFEGMEIRYSEEPEILGHAGGLRQAAELFDGDPFLVINGDVYADIDCAAVMRFHRERGARVTIVAKTDLPDSDLNLLGFDERGALLDIRGEPARPAPAPRRGINIGVFAYDPAFLVEHVPNGRFSGFSEVLAPLLARGDHGIFVYPWSGFWSDIGNERAYLDFLIQALDGRVPGLRGGHCVSATADIAPDAAIAAPCRIAPGCVIGPRARVGPHAVLCRGARVGAGASAARCMIAPGASVPPNAGAADQIVCASG
jgi:NDP-sugar pyrophosphorylase family protein